MNKTQKRLALLLIAAAALMMVAVPVIASDNEPGLEPSDTYQTKEASIEGNI